MFLNAFCNVLRLAEVQEYDAVTGLASGGVAGVGLELAATPPSSSSPASSSVLVAGVVAGSPAEKAGILTGDLLKAVDGEEVKNAALNLDVCALCQIRSMCDTGGSKCGCARWCGDDIFYVVNRQLSALPSNSPC